MSIFSVQDRQEAFDYILSVARECGRIVALVQVGSGAAGFRDERSDLDFVIALDADDAMAEVMEYMHRRITEKYDRRLEQYRRGEKQWDTTVSLTMVLRGVK